MLGYTIPTAAAAIHEAMPLTASTAIPLIIAAAAILTTIRRALSAHVDRRELCRAILAGEIRNTRKAELHERLVNATIRREWLRVFKSIVAGVAVCTTFYDFPYRIDFRNWLMAIVALALVLNSVLDELVQRWALRQAHSLKQGNSQ